MGGVTLVVVAGALYFFSSSEEPTSQPSEVKKEQPTVAETNEEVRILYLLRNIEEERTRRRDVTKRMNPLSPPFPSLPLLPKASLP